MFILLLWQVACPWPEFAKKLSGVKISGSRLFPKPFFIQNCLITNNVIHLIFTTPTKDVVPYMQQHLKIIKQQLFLYRDEKARSISIFCAPTLPLTQQQSTNSIGALLLRYVHLPKRPMGMASLFNTRSTRCGFREFWCRRSGNPVPWFNKHNFSPLDPNEHVNISIW